MESKQCIHCGEIKTLDNFYNGHNQCKDCKKEYQRKYRKLNKHKINKYNKEYNKKSLNKKDRKEYSKRYYEKNKSKILLKSSEYHKEYWRRPEVKERARKRYVILSNELKIKKVLRTRIWKAIKSNDAKKSLHTMELLGCSIEKLKQHLQKTAINNGYLDFDINKYKGGEYHIDHIRPCSSFGLTKEEEQRKCFNYKNLQILTTEENLIKGDKL